MPPRRPARQGEAVTFQRAPSFDGDVQRLAAALGGAKAILDKCLSGQGKPSAWAAFEKRRARILMAHRATLALFVTEDRAGRTVYLPDLFTPRHRFNQWADLVWLHRAVVGVASEHAADRFTFERVLRDKRARGPRSKISKSARAKIRYLYPGVQMAVRQAWDAYRAALDETGEIDAALTRVRNDLRRRRRLLARAEAWALLAPAFRASRTLAAAQLAGRILQALLPGDGQFATALRSGKF